MVAHVTGAIEDQSLIIGPQTFLEIKNLIRGAEQAGEVNLHVFYQPDGQDQEYLYDLDPLERGDSMEIQSILGSTWLVRNSETKELLVRYTVVRPTEDSNLVILSNSSTVVEDPTSRMNTKINFINELGFTILILKVDEQTLEEEPIAEIVNHDKLLVDTLVGQEFLVRKADDNTLGAVVLAALEEQVCPLGDET